MSLRYPTTTVDLYSARLRKCPLPGCEDLVRAYELRAWHCLQHYRNLGPPFQANKEIYHVKCRRYTYYPSDGLCTLHEQCGALSEDCEDCVSGQVNCPACNVQGQCEGINFHLEPEVELQQCLVCKFESEQTNKVLTIPVSGAVRRI